MKFIGNFFLTTFVYLFIITSLNGQDDAKSRWQKRTNRSKQLWEKQTTSIKRKWEEMKGWDNVSFSDSLLFNLPPISERFDPIPEEENPQGELSHSPIKLWAIIIGVSNYQNNHLINDLNYSDDDAYNFARFLSSPSGGAIPNERMFLLIDEDANQIQVEAIVEKVFKRANENDGIILYFSGHGSPSSFILSDYNSPKICNTASNSQLKQGVLSHTYLNTHLRNSRAKYKFCFIDACHSGGLVEAKSAAEAPALSSFYTRLERTNPGTVYILSSREKEISLELKYDPELKIRSGLFTHFLMKGLYGHADYNNDNIISIIEIFNYTKKNVMQFTMNQQTPVISGNYSPEMPIGAVGNSK